MSWGASKEDWLHFDLILGLGADLLPVVSNPEAEISPDSRMKSKGKTPSVYNRQRKVAGFPKWTAHSADADDLERWAKEEDYGICVQTRTVRALDIDVPDVRLSDRIEATFLRALGQAILPTRMRAGTGKRLLAFLLQSPMRKRAFNVDGGLVELLATGQQFIAVGEHFDGNGQPSGTRYEWIGGLPDEFPAIAEEDLERAWAAIRDEFATAPERRAAERGEGSGGGEDMRDDFADWLEENWETYGRDRGKLFICCPWKEGHSGDSGESEASWALAGSMVTLSPQPQASVSFGFWKVNFDDSLVVT